MSEHHYIPVDQLDPELRKYIPAGDNILYTTRAEIFKTGFGGDRKYGFLAVTDNGIAFRAAKMGFMTASIVSAARGALEGYVPYSLIYEFKNHRDKIRIKHTLADNPQKKRGYIFKVERCKSHDEPKDTFKQRKPKFGDFIEQVFQQQKGS